MFKSLLLASSLVLSFVINAEDTIESANKLFSKRGEDIKSALEASKIYKSLADSESEKLIKAQLYTKEAQSIYFYAAQNKDASKKELLKDFNSGMDAANNAINLLADESGLTTNEEYKAQLASAYYFYSANLGKWGETKGVLASLGKWKSSLRPTLLKIVKLDPTVEEWGANRILGRAFQKVPYESTSKGLTYLQDAFDNTLNEDYGLSSNMTTNQYLLSITKEEKEWDTFCEIYSAVEEIVEDEEAPSDLNPLTVPETKIVIKEIMSNKSFAKSYAKKCE